MSVQAMEAVLRSSRAKGSELLVLLLVANHAGSEDHSTWVSATTLAAEARMSERQVRRILQRLATPVEEGGLGELEITPRPGRPSVLRLLLPGQDVRGPDVRRPEGPEPQMSATPDIAMSGTPDTAMSDEPSEPSRTVSSTPPARDLPAVGLSLPPQGGGAPSVPRVLERDREVDPIFEALYLLEAGEPYTPEGRRRLTRKAAAALNAAAAEIRATGISAAELRAAIAAWPRLMGSATCTAHAVAKHLPRLLAAARGVVASRGELDEVAAEVERRLASRTVGVGGG